MTSPVVLMKDTLLHETPPFTFGQSVDWSLWIGKQPASPDRSITIYSSGGLAPNPRWLLDYPSVQFRIRGGQNDYDVAENKARDVRRRLLGRESYDAFDGLGDRIVMITAIGDVAFMGWGRDDKVRPEFVFNLALTIEPAPVTGDHRDPLNYGD